MTTTTIGTIGISVFSGILTSFLLALIVIIFKQSLIPWYQELIYNGIKLNGKWDGGTNTTNAKIEASIELNQHASNIEGVFLVETIYHDKQVKPYKNQYKISGTIVNNIVKIHYKTASSLRTGTGVGLFEITNGGNKLLGHIVHSEDSSGKSFYLKDFILKRSN
jgi:hypothetical protein